MNNNTRVVGLDIIRSIAVFLVIFGHCSFLFNPLIKVPIFGRIILYFTTISEIIAYFGVELFFVLSGFLISNILHEILNSTTDFKLILKFFLFSRWLRTLPNYYLFLLVNYLLFCYIEPSFRFDIRYILFVQNIITSHPLFFKEAWSLSVEEWFYLFFPLVTTLGFIGFKVSLKKTLFITVIGFILFSLLCKIYFINIFRLHYDFDEYFRKIVIFRFDAIAIGIFGFWISKYYNLFWIKSKFHTLIVSLFLIPISVLGFFILYKNNFKLYKSNSIIYMFTSVFFTTIWSIIILGIFPFFSSFLKFKSQICNQIFKFFSTISYSLYLCNVPILILFKRTIYIQSNTFISAALNVTNYLLILITVSFITYKYYERIFLNLRTKVLSYYNLKIEHDK